MFLEDKDVDILAIFLQRVFAFLVFLDRLFSLCIRFTQLLGQTCRVSAQ